MSDHKKNPSPLRSLEQNKDVPPNNTQDSNLLSRPHPKGYTEEWVESLKHSTLEESIPKQSLLVFRIKSEWLALPSHCIKEVTKTTFIHRLPHTNSTVLLGITNVQGELLVTTSMQNLLGIPDPTQPTPKNYTFNRYSRFIVFGNKKDSFVFPADELFGLTHVKFDAIEPVPISIVKSLKNYFSGIFILPESNISVGLLDDKLIIDSLNENYL